MSLTKPAEHSKRDGQTGHDSFLLVTLTSGDNKYWQALHRSELDDHTSGHT